MAAEGETNENFRAHMRGYDRFLGLMKWGTILSFITGAVVVLIIAS